MGKTSTFLRECLLKSRTAPQPGDELFWNTFERDRGKVSNVKNIADAIAGVDGYEYSNGKRIDEPFRDITIRTWYNMFHIGNYYAGLFVPDSEDKKFKRQIRKIWDVLIRNTIMGSVFLGYGEDLVELDRQILIQKNDLDGIPKARLSCPFRLYTRVGFGKYYSILAGHEIENNILEDRLVQFCIDGSNYWLEWWHILTETLGAFERVKSLAKFAAVRTIVSVDEGEAELQKELYDAMESLYPVLCKKGGVAAIKDGGGGSLIDNEYQPHEFTPPNLPRELFDFYVNYFDLITDQLGYAGKSSPHKMERLTHQESLQGSNVVSTIQYYLCERINSCFDVCREVFGEEVIPEDFEVTISNQMAANAILEPQEVYQGNNSSFSRNNEQGHN